MHRDERKASAVAFLKATVAYYKALGGTRESNGLSLSVLSSSDKQHAAASGHGSHRRTTVDDRGSDR
jgi:hypothetical protein